jgi:hypothetical protein
MVFCLSTGITGAQHHAWQEFAFLFLVVLGCELKLPAFEVLYCLSHASDPGICISNKYLPNGDITSPKLHLQKHYRNFRGMEGLT